MAPAATLPAAPAVAAVTPMASLGGPGFPLVDAGMSTPPPLEASQVGGGVSVTTQLSGPDDWAMVVPLSTLMQKGVLNAFWNWTLAVAAAAGTSLVPDGRVAAPRQHRRPGPWAALRRHRAPPGNARRSAAHRRRSAASPRPRPPRPRVRAPVPPRARARTRRPTRRSGTPHRAPVPG